MPQTNECPFIVGQKVKYRPSEKGISSDAMSFSQQKLTVEKVYTIKNIIDDKYIIVDGYHHPGGGLYWSEFSSLDC